MADALNDQSRRMLIIVTGFVLAWLVFISTILSLPIASKVQSSIPRALPRSGFSEAIAMQSSYADHVRGNPKFNPTQSQFERASDILKAEPLAINIVPLMARYLNSTGRRDKAFRLMQTAYKISRRNLGLNNDLMAELAGRDQLKEALQVMDVSMRVSNDARRIYTAALAEQTRNNATAKAILPLLRSNPVWAKQYWREVLNRSQSLQGGAALRKLLIEENGSGIVPTEEDILLVKAIADRGNISDAYNLALTLGYSGSDIRHKASKLRPPFEPFDWRIVSTGGMYKAERRENHSLDVFVAKGGQATIASKIVPSLNGKGILVTRYGRIEGQSDAKIFVTSTCVDTSKQIWRLELFRNRFSYPVDNSANSGCPWMVLDLYVDAGDAISAVELHSFDLDLAGRPTGVND